MSRIQKQCRLSVACVVFIGIAFLSIAPPLDAGSISGEVKFGGIPPGRNPIQVTKDQDYCGRTVPDESILVGPGGGLQNVVVYIDGPSTRPASSGKENILESHGCLFVPHVMAMAWGERLVVKNSDPKLHIVHSYFDKQTVFNLAVPFRGQSMEITHKIKKPGLLQVNCDTHTWMRGYVYVFGHPFFAVTDERGFFSVPNVPAGVYTLKAWHEKAGVNTAEVKVPAEGEIRVNFEFGR